MNAPAPSIALPHLAYLDGWRGLAIGFLLVGHFYPVPGINFGAVGVNLFFVLSGFLMGQLLFVKKVPIPTFYKRRISRIIPAHVFFIFAVSCFYIASGHPISWHEIFAALFFVNNYINPGPGNEVMPFGHIWSLSVEEHSYIALSLIAIAARLNWINARTAIACAVALFSALGFCYWSTYSGKVLYFKWLHSEVSAYGIFVSSLLLLVLTLNKFRLHSLAFAVLLGFGILMHWWSVPNPIRTTLGVGVFALAVNALPNASVLVQRILSFKPLRLFGLWSFSIYLWQQPFYFAAKSGSIPTYLALALAIFFGIASFYLLENPARSYLNRVWGKSS
jgi:peptidoglycan/LPS O-acetylase OafA/YrhL